MRIIAPILTLLLILLTVGFACLNATPVRLNFYLGTANPPLSLLLAFILIIGVVLGWIVSFGFYLKLKAKHTRLRQRLKLVEEEVSNLRTIPVKNEP
jgi:uncharacterized membrane protein YciS (DUF1049 family)